MAEDIARETGCLIEEAERALQLKPNVSQATRLIQDELHVRRQRYMPILALIWARYAPANATVTDYDGTIALVNDLMIPLEDETVLALAYELKAPKVGVFAKQSYIDGWARWSAVDLNSMVSSTQVMKQKMQQDQQYFSRVYRFIFGYIAPEGQRVLPLELATAYWQLLLVPRFAVAQAWIKFMQEQKYSVSRDTWNMILVFCLYLNRDPHMTEYDETQAWPAIIDDFVETLRGVPT